MQYEDAVKIKRDPIEFTTETSGKTGALGIGEFPEIILPDTVSVNSQTQIIVNRRGIGQYLLVNDSRVAAISHDERLIAKKLGNVEVQLIDSGRGKTITTKQIEIVF